jgi:hypothetical protein
MKIIKKILIEWCEDKIMKYKPWIFSSKDLHTKVLTIIREREREREREIAYYSEEKNKPEIIQVYTWIE